MNKRIAYLGDGSRSGSANYLCGIMTHFALPFVYVPSDESPPEDIFADEIGLYILSDYPAERFSAVAMERLCERIRRKNAGILMLGGWESYHGLGGNWDTTPLAKLLPVEMSTTDDRRNWAQLILIRQIAEHEITAGLPFSRPAGIGGYNEFRARAEATVILEGERFQITCEPDSAKTTTTPTFVADGRFPLLVVAKDDDDKTRGRRACFATDVAPHWVGGFVDWGDARLTVTMGEDFVEIGADYATFFRNLLTWCLGN